MAPEPFSSPHHLVHHCATTSLNDYSAPSSSCTSSCTSSPPSSASSPRSSRDGAAELGRAPPSLPDDDPERDFASNTSDSYDSAGEATGVNLRAGAYGSSSSLQYAHWGTDDSAGSYYDHSRVSSRANSPAPQAAADQLWDGYRSEPLAYKSISRNRSRNVSGTTTPTSGVDKEGQHSSDCALDRLSFASGGSVVVTLY
jgi:hypothetical protein